MQQGEVLGCRPGEVQECLAAALIRKWDLDIHRTKASIPGVSQIRSFQPRRGIPENKLVPVMCKLLKGTKGD